MAIEKLMRIDKVDDSADIAVNVNGRDYRASSPSLKAYVQEGLEQEIQALVDEATEAAEAAEESAAEAAAAAGVVGPQVREALRRSYDEAGHLLIGDFSDTGLVVTSATDVVLWEPTGIAYAYSGTLPHTIGAGETPVGNPLWIPKDADSFRSQVAAPDGSSKVGFLQAGVGSVPRTAQDKMRDVVHADDVGLLGDGVADENVKLQHALTIAAGRTLQLGVNKVYVSSEPLIMPLGVKLNLNGSTLRFTCVGGKRNLAVNSNCVVTNGRVENVVGSSGFEGTLQTPITVGEYTKLIGVKNVKLSNLEIYTVTPQGNGIAIFGDSHNIVIDNIAFPDNEFIGIPIMTHWSFDGVSSAGGTTHPHNIKISNIYCGDLTYNPGAGLLGNSVVFLSASYNIEVSNIYVKNFQFGKVVTVYAGDWGYQFATPLEQALGSVGININGLYGKALIGVQVYNKNPLEAVKKVWPGSVRVCNANVLGVASSSSRGFMVELAERIEFDSCVFDGFQLAGQFDTAVKNFSLLNCEFRRSTSHGLAMVAGADLSSRILIDNCYFQGNNTGAAASTADVFLTAGTRITINDCEFNSALCAWNVRADNTVSRLRLIDNNIVGVGAGPSFSLGVGADVNICSKYEGNLSETTAANGIRGGQLMIPFAVSSKPGTADAQKVAYFNTSPDRGSWVVGDRVFNSSAAVGQPKSWVCTVSGTPGTWVSEGVL